MTGSSDLLDNLTKEQGLTADETADFVAAQLKAAADDKNVPDMSQDRAADARSRGFRMANGIRYDRQAKTDGVNGKEVEIDFATRKTVKGRYKVIDGASLQPSHKGGERNPLHFIPEAQPKERTDQVSEIEARRIAGNIMPDRITASTNAYGGAPVTNSRGEVIQGNNRANALKQMPSDQQTKYKQWLVEHADEFGLNADEVAQMQNPVLVREVDVTDEEAIRLGQYRASDLESGGTERIDARSTMGKMNERTTATALSRLFDGDAEDRTIGQLIEENGASFLKYLNQVKAISDTQFQSAFKNDRLTDEAKSDIRRLMLFRLFDGGADNLERMFDKMPSAAQKALLPIIAGDAVVPEGASLREELQRAIIAANELMASGFMDGKRSLEDVRTAFGALSRQMDMFASDQRPLNERFSPLELEIAARLLTEKQSTLKAIFAEYCRLVIGTEGDMFNPAERLSRAEAVERVFNIKDIKNNETGGETGNVPESVSEGRRGEEGTAEQGAEGQQEEVEPTAKEDESDGQKPAAESALAETPSAERGKLGGRAGRGNGTNDEGRNIVSTSDSAEIEAIRNNITSALSAENLEKAKGKTREEIFALFGNDDAMVVGFVPEKWLKYLGEGIKDNRIYTGLGYFIDHAVNHHPNIETEKYLLMQEVLNEPDSIKAVDVDGHKSVAFIKKLDKYNAVVIEVEQTEDGRIIWHKSFYDQRKEPYKKSPDLRGDISDPSVGGGGIPISHTEPRGNSVPGSNRLSTPTEESRRKDSNNSAEKQDNEQKTANSPLIKGEKWEKTGEPQRFKAGIRKHANSHDAYFRLGNKLYGLTTADAQLDDYLVETYGNYTNIWNAYERGEILLSPELAAAIKAKVQFLEEGNMTPKTATIDDAIKFSIRVNHNSPYLLKKADGSFVDPETGERLGFDHRFMGSGEGAQAHGWGSYFSVKDIRRYAGDLGDDIIYKGAVSDDVKKSVVRLVLDRINIEGYSVQAAIKKETKAWEIEGQHKYIQAVKGLAAKDFVKPILNRHHYSVEIPDNDGTNYIEEDEPLTDEQIDRVLSLLDLSQYRDGFEERFRNGYTWQGETTPRANGRMAYKQVVSEYGSEEKASKILHDAGFVGIHYDGRRDGECYVIFDENDAKIVDHVRFSKKERKGIVAPNLASKSVEVVEADAKHGFKNNKAAIDWSKENIIKTYTDEETGGKGNITIPASALSKFISNAAVAKSENRDVHLATLKVLPQLLAESIDAEQHANYQKINGVRGVENPVSPNEIIHRLYGAVGMDGKTYRVKITLKELSEGTRNTYSYETTKIELLNESNSSGIGEESVVHDYSPQTRVKISAAKLLQGVEKSYEKGKYLLDESENLPENVQNEEENVRFSRVTDPQKLDELNNGKTIKVYRAMQLQDGKLYPPMSGMVDGKWQNAQEMGEWYQSDERPDLLDKKGKFVLKKNPQDSGMPVAYNPYWHTSRFPLNDQFASAWNRPELVTVEVEIPESELTSGYKAEGAKNAVGETTWKAGPVADKLYGTEDERKVILSRYNRLVRIVPDSEVAASAARILKKHGLAVPFNVVTPSLRDELVKQGVTIGAPTRHGSGVKSVPAYEQWTEGVRFSRRPATALIMTLQDKPLRDQMGSEQWTDEMRRLYATMGESERRQIVHKMLQSGGRGALANAMSGWMADRVFGYDEQPDGWDEVCNSVRRWTRGLGYDGVLTDGECDYVIWRSNLAERQGGRMSVRDMVADTLLRERLGIDTDDLDPNDGVRFSKVFGGNSGYVGYSKSRRAVRAEEAGLRNKSQMDKEFADEVNELILAANPNAEKVTLKQIKDALSDIKADEWHHTSMYGNRTNYYSAETIAEYFTPETEEEKAAREDRETLQSEYRKAYAAVENAVWENVPHETIEDPMRIQVGGRDMFRTSAGHLVEHTKNVLSLSSYSSTKIIPSGLDYLVDGYDKWAYEHSKEYETAIDEYNAAKREAFDHIPQEMKDKVRDLHEKLESVRFSRIKPVNDKFNEELQQQIDGTLPMGHTYQLGMPSEILRSAGIANLPIELQASRLSDKSMQENHPFDLSEAMDLPRAIQEPLAVFRSATHIGDHVILTSLKHDGRNFVAAIRVNKIGKKIEVNSIRSLHYRNGLNIVGWINEGLADYIKPSFADEWLEPLKKELRPKPQYNSADVRAQLESAAKIVRDFQNPKLSDEKVEDETRFSRVYHGSGADFNRFDHSHMGEGEGAQAYGWGSYVTEVEGTGRKYAISSSRTTYKGFDKEDLDSLRNLELPESERKAALILLKFFNGDRDFSAAVEHTRSFFKERADRFSKQAGRTAKYFMDYFGFSRSEAREFLKKSKKKAEEYSELLDAFDSLDEADFRIRNRYLYEVEIPDDNGENYLEWDKPVADGQLTAIDNALAATGARRQEIASTQNGEPKDFVRFTNENAIIELYDSIGGEKLYRYLGRFFNSDKAASQFLNGIGIVGIKYPAEFRSGGREDGAKNYVIFNEDDAEIVNHTRFSRTRRNVKELDKEDYGVLQHRYNEALAEVIKNGGVEEDLPNEMLAYTKNHLVTYTTDGKGNIKPLRALFLNEENIERANAEIEKFERYADRIPESVGVVVAQSGLRQPGDGNNRGQLRAGGAGREGRIYPVPSRQEPDQAGSAALVGGELGGRVNRSVDDEIRQSRPRRPLPRTTASQSVAGRIYNEGVTGFWNGIKEGYHDYLRSVRVLQEAVAAESGKPLQDHENVYLHNLFLQRRNQAEWQQYMNRLVEPLLDTIKGITRNAKDKEAAEVELGRYLNAVHGLERNEYMAKQHPKTPRKDYSGLTAIFTRSGETNVPIDELEQRARDFIADYENRIGDKAKDELWAGIDGLRSFMLDKMYNSGLITKALHDELKDRYKHYVPLRGWRDETKGTAEDFYNYVSEGGGSGESIMQNAKGRNSEAADILATLMHLGHAAIHQGNKNRALQSLLALAEDHKVPLLTAKLAWYEKQNVGGVDTWVIIAPPDTSAMNETDAADALNQFEADMRAKMQAEPTRYKNGGGRVDVGVPVNHIGNLKQHQVRVMRGGKTYIININGQPKAAQALNGQLKESAPKWVEGLNRFIARNLTTLNPEFIVSNFERDFASANVMTFARYGLKEAAKMDKSMFNNLWRLFSLYEKGQLDMNNEQHRLFDEFMRNGGETGFGIVLQTDDYQKRIMDAVKNKHHVVEAILSVIEAGNRGIENMMRFAAYIVARKSGRSILQAINDSAEVSVNFNRTGSGAMGAKYFKGLYVFFNAGVQGLAQRLQGLFQLNPRMYAAIGCEMALGFLISALNIYWGGDDDDDELDEPYMRLGEFRRYNSINIMLPWWDKALRWDLSHEDAAWYGIGAILGEYAMGYHHDNEFAKLIFGQLTQALPIDLAAYHDGDMGIIEAPLRELMPTALRPWMEAYSWNEDFQGRPINNQKVKGELGDNSILPEYRRVTKRNEISLANAVVEWMDKANGADDYHRSWYEKALGNFAPNADNINYIVGGYLGGPWTFMNKVRMTMSGEAELRDYPIASRLMTDIGSDYAKNRQLKSEFDYYHGMVEETENREKVAKRDYKEANGKKRISRKDEAKAYELLEDDFGYRLQQIWKSGRGRKTLEKRYEKAVEERKQLYKIGDTEGIERNQAEIYSIMRDAVKAWREAE